MSEPLPQQPFTPDAPATTPGGGCGRPLLIGCGILIVLLGIAAAVFVIKAKDLFGWAMAQFEEEVVRMLPDDLTTEERQRLDAAFDAALDAWDASEADPVALQRLQEELWQTISRNTDKLSREDVAKLTRALERVAGVESPDEPEAEPPPAEGEEPTPVPAEAA
ncbi:MAG: hypothetical protein EP299_00435 [Acidobacteria bacterium]|nr:MAG: hypothetical protein EP299_00435 [Acidobacteriota bacterium]